MTTPGYNAEMDRALYRDANDTITPDHEGHEWFVEPQYARRPTVKSPLMADVPGADASIWSDLPRPAVTAWEGADMDAYWLDGETWRHCQTGAVWGWRAYADALDEAIFTITDQIDARRGCISRNVDTELLAAVAGALEPEQAVTRAAE